MQTPSHFLMTAALRKAMPRLQMIPTAVLTGSIAPDIPLYLLYLGAAIYYPYFLGWSAGNTARHVFGTLYFEDPYWIGLHNVLHSPVCLVPALALLWIFRRGESGVWRWLSWFLAACLLHSMVDIATHFDDGPVLFWPLDWSTRFASPVSYWDDDHYGREFANFEFKFAVTLSAYLFLPWLWRQAARRLGPRDV